MKLATPLFFTLLIALMNVPKIYAQEQPGCGLHYKLTELYTQYPGLEADQHELLERSKHYSPSGDREEIYIIPVVFHVIHENGVENISDAQIMDQMRILNEDYRKKAGSNGDKSTNPNATDIEFEFRLAQVDPNGIRHDGINRIQSSKCIRNGCANSCSCCDNNQCNYCNNRPDCFGSKI
jgi:hypothetical protein